MRQSSEMSNDASVGDGKPLKSKFRRRVLLSEITRSLYRRYEARDAAVELFIGNHQGVTSWFLYFPDLWEKRKKESGKQSAVQRRRQRDRDKVMRKIWSFLSSSTRANSVDPNLYQTSARFGNLHDLLAPLVKAWQSGALSNFEYLMELNLIAGRSELDLSQYPVFPWIVSNYVSQSFDTSDPSNYRDLSKPMGAVNPERLQHFDEKYASYDGGDIPKFFYGSHYSTTGGVVLYFLVRIEPFASLHIKLQDGHFDYADRLFNSVAASYEMCTTSFTEVKEVVPEFYSSPEFLRNRNRFPLGTKQDGSLSDDVKLPPYVTSGQPEEFISIMRAALESEYVSSMLHHWVDLIFGFQQSGPEAVAAKNVFYYLTYPGAVDINSIQEEAMRKATLLQIANFGQCPQQIFLTASPSRGHSNIPKELSWKPDELCGKPLTSNHVFEIARFNGTTDGMMKTARSPDGQLVASSCAQTGVVKVFLSFSKLHESSQKSASDLGATAKIRLTARLKAFLSPVTCVAINSDVLVVGGSSGRLKVFKLLKTTQSRGVFFHSHLSLQGHHRPPVQCAIFPHGNWVASYSPQKCLVHSLLNGRLVAAFECGSVSGVVRSTISGKFSVFE